MNSVHRKSSGKSRVRIPSVTVPLVRMDKRQHWNRLTWSAGYYSIDVPDDWEIQDQRTMVVFTAPRDAASFSVAVYEKPPRGTLKRFAQVRFAHQNKHFQPVGDPYYVKGTNWDGGIAQESLGRLPDDDAPVYRWNVCLKHPSAHIGIILHTSPETAVRCRLIFERIFSSLRLLPSKK